MNPVLHAGMRLGPAGRRWVAILGWAFVALPCLGMAVISGYFWAWEADRPEGTVPVTGRQSFNLVPDSQANALGTEAFAQVKSESKLITSGSQYDQVLRVGKRIAAIAEEPSFDWEFMLLDDPKTIRKNVMRAVTDSGTDVVFDRERAGLYNLLSIYQSLTGQTPAQIEAHFAGRGYGELKKDLADLIVAALEPLQRRYREVTCDPGFIDSVLAASVARLRPIAEATMAAVRRAMGHR